MNKIKLSRTKFLWVFSFFVFFLPIGCTGVSTESGMMKDLEGVKLTYVELRILLNQFGIFFSETTEEAADEIMSKTNNALIKSNALQWKINVIPKAMGSLVILDPVAAGIDLYALSIQMNNFFTIGNGKELFGNQQSVAIRASENILKEIRSLTDSFRSPENRIKTEQQLQEWARENPIENISFNRRSTLEVLAKALGSQSYTLGETVGTMAEGVYDIRRQMAIYTAFLPKYMKWQVQLSAYEFLSDSLAERSFNYLDRIVRSTEEITSTVKESPDLLREIQLSTYAEINKQLLITLNTIKEERKLILSYVDSARIVSLENINKQRLESFDKVEKITKGAIIQSSLIADDIVDKIFIRLLILVLLFIIGIFIFGRVWKTKIDSGSLKG